MRRAAIPAIAILVATWFAVVPRADAEPPPGYGKAVAGIIDDGRAVSRLVAAGEANALHSRFAPEPAQEVSEAELRELLTGVLSEGRVGPTVGESALPLGPDRRGYLSDRDWAGGILAIELSLDRRGRITSFRLDGRTPLPPDPGTGREVVLRFPLAGTWWVYWGGPTERQNYHATTPDQRHAYDLVRWKGGATSTGAGTRNRHYYAFNRRVLAPADGVVIEAQDGVRDNRPSVGDANPAAPAGNHVLIAVGTNQYVLLAHLRRGTVGVDPGQHVQAGEPVGRVGNSGNSSEPHLHVHVQDQPTLGAGVGLPVLFGPLVLDGMSTALATPVQGQFVAPG